MWRLILAALCGFFSVSVTAASETYDCSKNGIFPVQGSCNSYYVCIDGTEFTEFCPFSLIFDPTSLACNYPDVLNITSCSAKEFFNFDCSAASVQSFVAPERRNPTLPAPPAPRESDVDRYYYSYPYYYSYYYYYPYYTYWYYYWRSIPDARNTEGSPLKKSPEMPKATNAFEEEANRIYYSYYYPYYYYYYYPYYYTYYWRNAEVDKRSPDAAFPLSLPEPERRSAEASEAKSEEASERSFYYPYYYSYWYYPSYYSYWRNANPDQVRDDTYYITKYYECPDGEKPRPKPKSEARSYGYYPYSYDYYPTYYLLYRSKVNPEQARDDTYYIQEYYECPGGEKPVRKPKTESKSDAENRYDGYYYPYYYSYWYYPGYYWRDSAAEKSQEAHKTSNRGYNDYFGYDGGYDTVIDIYFKELAEKIEKSQGPVPLPIPSADRKAPTQDESNPTSRYDGYYYPYYYSYYYYPYYYYWRNMPEGQNRYDGAHIHHGDAKFGGNRGNIPFPVPSANRKTPSQDESNPTSRYDGYYYPYYYSYYYYPYYYYWRSAGEEKANNVPLSERQHGHGHHDHHDHWRAAPNNAEETSRRYYSYPYSYGYYPYSSYGSYPYSTYGSYPYSSYGSYPYSTYGSYYNRPGYWRDDEPTQEAKEGSRSARMNPFRTAGPPSPFLGNQGLWEGGYGKTSFRTAGPPQPSEFGGFGGFGGMGGYGKTSFRTAGPPQPSEFGGFGGFGGMGGYGKTSFRTAGPPEPSEFGGLFGGLQGGGVFRYYSDYYNSYYYPYYYWTYWRSNGVEVPKSVITERDSAWYVNYNWNNTQSHTSQTGSYTSFCSASQCKLERNIGTGCSSSYFLCMANGQPRLLACPMDFVFNSVTGMCGPRDEVPACKSS